MISDVEILRQFYEDATVRNLSPKTLAIYRYFLEKFLRFLEMKHTTLEEVERDTIRAWIMFLKGSPTAFGRPWREIYPCKDGTFTAIEHKVRRGLTKEEVKSEYLKGKSK